MINMGAYFYLANAKEYIIVTQLNSRPENLRKDLGENEAIS